jgi:hypothetical protein
LAAHTIPTTKRCGRDVKKNAALTYRPTSPAQVAAFARLRNIEGDSRVSSGICSFGARQDPQFAGCRHLLLARDIMHGSALGFGSGAPA